MAGRQGFRSTGKSMFICNFVSLVIPKVKGKNMAQNLTTIGALDFHTKDTKSHKIQTSNRSIKPQVYLKDENRCWKMGITKNEQNFIVSAKPLFTHLKLVRYQKITGEY